jgi:hypothetical protein
MHAAAGNARCGQSTSVAATTMRPSSTAACPTTAALTGVVNYLDKKANGCDEFDAKFKAKSRRPLSSCFTVEVCTLCLVLNLSIRKMYWHEYIY